MINWNVIAQLLSLGAIVLSRCCRIFDEKSPKPAVKEGSFNIMGRERISSNLIRRL